MIIIVEKQLIKKRRYYTSHGAREKADIKHKKINSPIENISYIKNLEKKRSK